MPDWPVSPGAGGVINVANIAATTDCPGSATSPPVPLGDASSSPPPFPCSMDTLERWSLEQALRFCGGMRMKTAAMLEMNYYTFRRRLEKHGITSGEE